MNFSFLNPWLLWALPLSLLPIVLHFFFRRPPKVIAFSDIRFLKKILEKYRPKKKLQEWLILLLRILSLACLFFFFSRPVMHWGLGGPGEKKEKPAGADDTLALVVLLDGSYSMRAQISGISLWEMAQGLAQKAFSALEESDRSSLIVFSNRIEFFSGHLSNDHQGASTKLLELSPTFRDTDIFPAFQLAYQVLSNSGATQKAILIFSDMAKNGWISPDGKSWVSHTPWDFAINNYDASVRVLYTDFQIAGTNAAVESFSLVSDFYSGLLKGEASLKNWGEKEISHLPLYLQLQGDSSQRMELNLSLEKKQSKKVSFSLPLSASDRYVGQIGIQPDLLPADDFFYFVHPSPKRVRLLCLEEPSGITALSGESFYLRQALLAPPAPFEIKTISVQDLKKVSLRDYDALLLVHPGPLERETAMEIQKFLKQGGSLLLAAGHRKFSESMSPLSDFLPCGFGEERRVTGLTLQPVQDTEDEEFLIFQREYEWDKINIEKIIQPILKENGEAWLTLSDGTPVLIFSKDKKVAVWMSSVDRSWNNFAAKPLFPPLMRWLAARLAASHRMEASTQFFVGQPFRKKFTQTLSKEQIRLLSPQAQSIPFQLQQRELISNSLEEPGIYSFMVKGNAKESFQFAVNINSQKGESDLTPVTQEELKKLLPKTFFQALSAGEKFEAELIAAMRGIEISRYFLLFAGMFLLSELWMVQKKRKR